MSGGKGGGLTRERETHARGHFREPTQSKLEDSRQQIQAYLGVINVWRGGEDRKPGPIQTT